MDKGLLLNGSGCNDYTAYRAIMNLEKGEKNMEYRRGEICEIIKKNKYGEEYFNAIVVSSEERINDNMISIVALSDTIHENSVPIVCGEMMYAKCGLVSYAHVDRFRRYIRTATEKEMKEIDEKISFALGIERKTVLSEICRDDNEVMAENVSLRNKLGQANNTNEKLNEKIATEKEKNNKMCQHVESLEAKIEELEFEKRHNGTEDELNKITKERDLYKDLYEFAIQKIVG